LNTPIPSGDFPAGRSEFAISRSARLPCHRIIAEARLAQNWLMSILTLDIRFRGRLSTDSVEEVGF